MIGGGVLIGKSLGVANYQKAQPVFQFATTLVLLLGGTLASTAPLVAKPLAQFLVGSGKRFFTAAMIAAMPIMAFNIGARQPGRVLVTLRFSLLYTMALEVLVAALGFLLPDQLVTLFSGDQSAQYHQVASQAMSLYFLLFLAAGPNYLLAAYLQSTRKPTVSILINCLKGFVLVILCLGMLPDRLGLAGVWLSRSLAEILTLLLVSMDTLYYRNKFYIESTLLPAA